MLPAQRGLTPRVFDYLFDKIRQEESNNDLEVVRYSCRINFLEIYNGGYKSCVVGKLIICCS